MKEVLKPCPCCGSTNVHAYNSKAAQYRQYSIKCKKCGLRVCKATLAEATDVWNQRTERTAKVLNDGINYCENCEGYVEAPMAYCPYCGCRLEW